MTPRAPLVSAEPALDAARAVLASEAGAVATLVDRLDGDLAAPFRAALALLDGCHGTILVSGLGKSGLVGRKIAATFTSTGAPAVFLHPVEALHGDIGLVRADDVALILSRSGSLAAFDALVPALALRGVRVIAMTGEARSELARTADVTLALTALEDAGPLAAIPTASTTAMLALGDALAVALLTLRGRSVADLAVAHPGGAIGRRLLVRVADILHGGDALPWVPVTASMRDAIVEISAKRLGMTCVLDADGTLAGVITDGDLKRLLQRTSDILALPVRDAMTRTPSTIAPEALAAAAVRRMEDHPGGPITSLVVTDANGSVCGVVHLHDCLRAGVL